jgi:hypothetical protein
VDTKEGPPEGQDHHHAIWYHSALTTSCCLQKTSNMREARSCLAQFGERFWNPRRLDLRQKHYMMC